MTPAPAHRGAEAAALEGLPPAAAGAVLERLAAMYVCCWPYSQLHSRMGRRYEDEAERLDAVAAIADALGPMEPPPHAPEAGRGAAGASAQIGDVGASAFEAVGRPRQGGAPVPAAALGDAAPAFSPVLRPAPAPDAAAPRTAVARAARGGAAPATTKRRPAGPSASLTALTSNQRERVAATARAPQASGHRVPAGATAAAGPRTPPFRRRG